MNNIIYFLYLKIIVVDDGSRDGTKDVVFSFMEDANSSVRLLKLGQNQGKGAALVNGVLRSRGKYILMVRR